jgi:antitoxin component YwqK of YwqJK toxin-antitoxin module
MYTDTCEFFSAQVYSDKGLNTNAIIDKEANTTYQNPILSLYNYTTATAIFLTDSLLNLSYYIYIDKPSGNIIHRSFYTADSSVYYSYFKSGTLYNYISSDYKTVNEKFFDENGKITSDTIKKDDFLDMYNTKYNSKGELLSKGKFKNELPHGKWKTYKNSKVIRIEKYKNGILLYKKYLY